MFIGRLVPIFANNKKKRLKQALYANPTTDAFEDSLTATSIDSNNGFKLENDYFEANETAPKKESFPRPQRLDSVNNEGQYMDGLSSTRQSHYPVRGRGGITNPPSGRGSHIGNNRGGLQNRVPVKQEPSRFQTGDAPLRAKNNGARSVGQHYIKYIKLTYVRLTFTYTSVIYIAFILIFSRPTPC